MYDNVPERFVPDDPPEPIYAHPDIDYVRNTDQLNCAYQVLEKGIERHDWGNNVALSYVEEDRDITYSELLADVETAAGVLRDLGVAPGDRVFWRLGDRPAAIVTQLATWKIGGVSVPSVLQERARELEYFVNDVEPAVLVTETTGFDEVEEVLPECPSVEEVVVVDDGASGPHRPYEELAAASDPFTEYVRTDPTDVATIYYSGGTSPGRSTGGIYSHASQVVCYDVNGGLCRGYGADDVIFEAAPIGHARGNLFKTMPFRFGGRTVLTHRPDPDAVLDILADHEVTVFTMVPTLGRMILSKGDPDAYDLSSIRLVVFSGERLDEDTYRRWDDLVDPEPCNAVGGTPIGLLFMTSYRDGEKYLPGRNVKPTIGFDMKLVDLEDPSREVGRNEIGQLALRGPADAAYWIHIHPDMPERMERDTLEDGWYLFDDAYSRDENGYFYFESRIDDLIQSGGRNISAIEVEEVLMDHELVDEVAVVGAPDDLRGQIVKAFIIAPTDADPTDDDKTAIQEFAKDNMAPFKYPREIEFVTDLPKNKAGKLKRAELVPDSDQRPT